MSDRVICLSDSEDEHVPNEEFNNAGDDANRREVGTPFEFPPIEFHCNVNKSRSVGDTEKEADHIIEKQKFFTAASSLDSSYSECSDENAESKVRSAKRTVLNNNKRAYESPEKRKKKKVQGTKSTRGIDPERISAKEQATIDKRLREVERRNRKNLKPENCLKFMRVSIDTELEDSSLHLNILDVLRGYDVYCDIESLPIPNSITWSRSIESHYLDNSNKICEKTETQEENQIVVVWKADQTVKSIKEQTFCSSVAGMVSLFPDHRLSLVIYGIEDYYEHCKKSKKQTNGQNHVLGRSSTYDLPKISRYDLDVSLAEIQLTLGCNSVLVGSSQELAMLVYRYTKAIASIPLRQETTHKIANKVDWYAMGDNKDTVKVDKNGNGLKRLWQQQLCQFNMAGLETAEAISMVYPSPRQLMEAYETCTATEGEKLLKDIPIRRAAGPLSASRKIGPELSKKVFVMFTSKDGDETLGNVS